MEREDTLHLTVAFLLSGCPHWKQQSQDISEPGCFPFSWPSTVSTVPQLATKPLLTAVSNTHLYFLKLGVHNPSLGSSKVNLGSQCR